VPQGRDDPRPHELPGRDDRRRAAGHRRPGGHRHRAGLRGRHAVRRSQAGDDRDGPRRPGPDLRRDRRHHPHRHPHRRLPDPRLMDPLLDPRIVGALGLMVLLTIAPGPDMALVISTSLGRRRRAAFRTALGISTGTLIWATLAGIGVAAILEASAEAFTVVRLLGAAYLCYLGIRALVQALRGRAAP